MAVLNWYDGTHWVPLYVPDITKRLVKYKNLSDVTNVQAARTNLGLTGDSNHTHYHDDRYMPLIDELRAELRAELNKLRAELRAELNKLRAELGQLRTDFDSYKTWVARSYQIGSYPKYTPINEGTIWFDLSSRTIKGYEGGQWKAFSGVYLNI